MSTHWFYKEGMGAYGLVGDPERAYQGSVSIPNPPDTEAVFDGAKWVQPTATDVRVDWRKTAIVPRAVFAERAAQAGIITWDDAAEWSAGNRLPSIAQTLLDSAPESSRARLKFNLLAKTSIRRNAPEVLALAARLGLTPEQVDALFS